MKKPETLEEAVENLACSTPKVPIHPADDHVLVGRKAYRELMELMTRTVIPHREPGEAQRLQRALLRHEVTDRAVLIQGVVYELDNHEGMAPPGHPADDAWQRLCTAVSDFVQETGRYENEP